MELTLPLYYASISFDQIWFSTLPCFVSKFFKGSLCAARHAAAFVRGDDVIHKLFTELAYRYKWILYLFLSLLFMVVILIQSNALQRQGRWIYKTASNSHPSWWCCPNGLYRVRILSILLTASPISYFNFDLAWYNIDNIKLKCFNNYN